MKNSAQGLASRSLRGAGTNGRGWAREEKIDDARFSRGNNESAEIQIQVSDLALAARSRSSDKPACIPYLTQPPNHKFSISPVLGSLRGLFQVQFVDVTPPSPAPFPELKGPKGAGRLFMPSWPLQCPWTLTLRNEQRPGAP